MNDPLQMIIDGMNAQAQIERSNEQMTLGELVSALSALPSETAIKGLSVWPMSYRGYYCDIAFPPGESVAGVLLEVAAEAIGQTFEGYKGGSYKMGKSTPVFVASYGNIGRKLMAIDPNGMAVTAADEC